MLDAVDFGVIRIAPDGKVAVTNEAHGRLQQAIRSDERCRGGRARVPRRRGDPPARRTSCRSSGRCAARRSTARSCGSAAEPGPRQALSITARRLTDSVGGGCRRRRHLARRDDRAECAARAGRARRVGLARAAHSAHLDPRLPRPRDRGPRPPRPPPLESRHRRAQRRAAAGHHRRHPRGVELVASSVEASLAPRVDRRARDRARRRPRPSRPRAAARAITIDTSGLEEAHRLGGSAAAAPGRRQPALERDHLQPRRRDGLPRHRPATAPPAGSWCATPGWA